jgi:TRAP-type transport system periplasmic protein
MYEDAKRLPLRIRRTPDHSLTRASERCVRRIRQWLIAGIAFVLLSVPAGAEVLRASHQFPGGKGDARDEMVQIIAREVAKANVGLEVQVYPGASLFKPNDQWNAMVKGQLDISSFPLDYASGKVPQFGATLMPALVRSHERAARLNKSPFMTDIRKIIEDNGVIVLADAWLAGAFGTKEKCILAPADAKGLKLRAAGPTFAEMWAGAGASIIATPSNEVYNALQTGVIDATDTSTGSFVSFRLYEQIKCITAPGDNALWFMYEPVLMSKMKFDHLKPDQQKALRAAGKKSEEYFSGAAKSLDDEMVQSFEKANSKVVTMSAAQFDAWLDLAKQTSYKEFAEKVEGGQKLLDEALAVK